MEPPICKKVVLLNGAKKEKKKESESVLLEQPLFSIHTVQSGQVTAK